MKKSDRIESFVADLHVDGARFDKCYLGYFVLFNSGRYYEAHDVLEHLWLEETGPDHAFFKGLIQIAGAFVHLKKQYERPDHPVDGRRLHPAARLFALGVKNIQPFQPIHMGLDVAGLCRLAECLASEISDTGFQSNPWSPTNRPQLKVGW
jgi:hypothetical protein